MNNIKKFRQEQKISQNKLACNAKIDLRYLQRIEKDEQIPTVFIAINISKALGKKVEETFISSILVDT